MLVNDSEDVEKNAFGTCALWGGPRLSMKLEFAKLLGGVLTGSSIEVEMVEETTEVDDDIEGEGVEADETRARDGQEGEIGNGALVANELFPWDEARVGRRWLHDDCDGDLGWGFAMQPGWRVRIGG